jgi:heat shock protein HtpX
MIITLFLLALVYSIFIAVLAYLGAGMLLMLALVGIFLLIQYFFSDRMVLWSMGAKMVSEQEYPRLYQTVTRLCAIAGLPQPKIAVVNTPVPNAFATGRNPRNAVVAVTTGLLSLLGQEELEAVIAHELSHVKNRDVMVITMASFLSTAAMILLRSFAFSGTVPVSSRGNRKGVDITILILILLAVVWIVSYLLIQALSRYREFSADRGSAVLTGQPSHLASALMKISGMMARVPTTDLRKVEGMNAFFIIPAFSGSWMFQLFSTHPPVEDRLAALERLERGMGMNGV